LSRWPIVETERRLLFHQPLPSEQRPAEYHLEQRVALGGSVDVRGTLIDVFCTHFDLTQDQRLRQAEDVATFCTGWHPGRPVVLMGDFNAFPDSPEIATLRGALTDVFAAEGVEGEERLTFPSGPLGSRAPNGWAGAIDYVFVSDHFRIEGIEVVRETTPASDHAPVIARLALS
jgi:endonuclease/exonuclease/phosphatase family metal-dependent hydrolase